MKRRIPILLLAGLLLLSGCTRRIPSLYEKGKYEKIIQMYEGDEDFPLTYLQYVADAYEQTGDKERALEIYEKLFSIRTPGPGDRMDEYYEKYLALKEELSPGEGEPEEAIPEKPEPEKEEVPKKEEEPEKAEEDRGAALTVTVNDNPVYTTDSPMENSGSYLVPLYEVIHPLNLYLYLPEEGKIIGPGEVPDVTDISVTVTTSPDAVFPVLGIYLGSTFAEYFPPGQDPEGEALMESADLRVPPKIIDGNLYLDARDIGDYIFRPAGGEFYPEGHVLHYKGGDYKGQ